MAGARCYDELSHSAPLKWYPPAAELRALCDNDSDCRFKVVLKHFHQHGLKENMQGKSEDASESRVGNPATR